MARKTKTKTTKKSTAARETFVEYLRRVGDDYQESYGDREESPTKRDYYDAAAVITNARHVLAQVARVLAEQQKRLPAAACARCGGWTPMGGMSQYAKSVFPVEGRPGCSCPGGVRVQPVGGLFNDHLSPQPLPPDLLAEVDRAILLCDEGVGS